VASEHTNNLTNYHFQFCAKKEKYVSKYRIKMNWPITFCFQ
jgi:hypothetical protein